MDKRMVRSKAPLRLGFAGGGTDLSPYADLYGGAILNATIGLFAYAAIEETEEKAVSFFAAERGERSVHNVEFPLPLEGPLLLHKGVYNRIIRDFRAGEPLPLRVTTRVDAPAGSGLGTSSTLVVAMVNAYKDLLKLPLGDYEIARLAFEIERRDLGLAGGRQDHYAATFGGINYMEFSANEKVIVNPLRVNPWILHELNYKLLLYYTGVSRSSASIIDSQISGMGKSADTVEAMHHVKEQAVLMKEAILTGRIDDIAGILEDAWQYKKRTSSDVSTPLIEEIYSTAMKSGALGGKISGAGGGGFFMLYVDSERRFEVLASMKRFGGYFLDYQFYNDGVVGWVVPKKTETAS